MLRAPVYRLNLRRLNNYVFTRHKSTKKSNAITNANDRCFNEDTLTGLSRLSDAQSGGGFSNGADKRRTLLAAQLKIINVQTKAAQPPTVVKHTPSAPIGVTVQFRRQKPNFAINAAAIARAEIKEQNQKESAYEKLEPKATISSQWIETDAVEGDEEKSKTKLYKEKPMAVAPCNDIALGKRTKADLVKSVKGKTLTPETNDYMAILESIQCNRPTTPTLDPKTTPPINYMNIHAAFREDSSDSLIQSTIKNKVLDSIDVKGITHIPSEINYSQQHRDSRSKKETKTVKVAADHVDQTIEIKVLKRPTTLKVEKKTVLKPNIASSVHDYRKAPQSTSSEPIQHWSKSIRSQVPKASKSVDCTQPHVTNNPTFAATNENNKTLMRQQWFTDIKPTAKPFEVRTDTKEQPIVKSSLRCSPTVGADASISIKKERTKQRYEKAPSFNYYNNENIKARNRSSRKRKQIPLATDF